MYGADANADDNDRETTLKITSTKLPVLSNGHFIN